MHSTRFAEWVMFGGKLIGHNDPNHHKKIIKFNKLPANCVSSRIVTREAPNA
jgi:hypothetical protein